MSSYPGIPARQVRRSSRSSSNGGIEIAIATAVAAFLITILDLVLAWPVMIALGVWHSYIHQVPALGWFASLVTLVAIGIVLLPSQVKSSDS